MFKPLLSCARPVGVGALVAAALALSGCASFQNAGTQMSTLGGLLTPHRIDIQQGNVVVREQLQALQPGMPRAQVQAILGTPLVASAFHAARWDYVFTFNRQGQEPQLRRVTVFFEGNALQRVEADELPTEQEFVASLQTGRAAGRIPVLQASEEQLRAFRERHPAPEARPTPPPVPAGPFPPLEAR
ncbi:MAG: outer membrane protein assembly factor BamE [Pseudomonadota bacterium]